MTVIGEVRAVSRAFGGVKAVDAVSATFDEGTLYGLIGPNGAGKSTLVNLMSGETAPDSGAVILGGRDVTGKAAHERALQGLGRTFQTMRLPGSMTAVDTVMSGCLIAAQASVVGYLLIHDRTRATYRRSRDKAERILALVGLDASVDAPVRELSFAEQRRLEIGRALSLEPRLLLLDEPTAGMHAELLPGVTRMLRDLANQGLSVVVIEHDVPFIRQTVDSLYAMDAGAIIGAGDPDAVLASEAVVSSYLGVHHGQ